MNFVPVRPRRFRRWRWRAARLARKVSRWATAAVWPVGTVLATAVWWAGHPDPSWWLLPMILLLFAAMLGAALIGRRNDDRHR